LDITLLYFKITKNLKLFKVFDDLFNLNHETILCQEIIPTNKDKDKDKEISSSFMSMTDMTHNEYLDISKLSNQYNIKKTTKIYNFDNLYNQTHLSKADKQKRDIKIEKSNVQCFNEVFKNDKNNEFHDKECLILLYNYLIYLFSGFLPSSVEIYFYKICNNLYKDISIIIQENQNYLSMPKGVIMDIHFVDLVKLLKNIYSEHYNFNTFFNTYKEIVTITENIGQTEQCN